MKFTHICILASLVIISAYSNNLEYFYHNRPSYAEGYVATLDSVATQGTLFLLNHLKSQPFRS